MHRRDYDRIADTIHAEMIHLDLDFGDLDSDARECASMYLTRVAEGLAGVFSANAQFDRDVFLNRAVLGIRVRS